MIGVGGMECPADWSEAATTFECGIRVHLKRAALNRSLFGSSAANSSLSGTYNTRWGHSMPSPDPIEVNEIDWQTERYPHEDPTTVCGAPRLWWSQR